MLCVLHLFCGNFTPIYSINLLHPMQQEAFPHQYLRSRICFARTIAHAFIMVLVQMCNPKIDNFDWIKMKGKLRLVIRIEHCSIPSLFFRSIRQTNIPYNRIVNKIFSCRYPAPQSTMSYIFRCKKYRIIWAGRKKFHFFPNLVIHIGSTHHPVCPVENCGKLPNYVWDLYIGTALHAV